MKHSIAWLVVSSVISGLLGVGISTYYYHRAEIGRAKIGTLKSIAAYRWCLTRSMGSQYARDQFFGSLNEAFVIYNDAQEVLTALENMNREISHPERQNDNLLKVIKAMCDETGIKYSSLNDAFILTPFTPGGSP
jgi:hypothetical protein